MSSVLQVLQRCVRQQDLQCEQPLQWLQQGGGQQGAGQAVGQQGAGQQEPSVPYVEQPVTNKAAAVTANARPVFFI